jgi:hypothetical protein
VGDEAPADDRAIARQDLEDPFGKAGLAVRGVNVAGFSTTVLPAASAGAKPQPAIGIGKFHGTMIPTTPSGS